MKKMFLIIIIQIFFLVGCSSYRDINMTMFSVMTIVDVDENNQPVVYMELFRALYDQEIANEKGERFILFGKGETIAEAISHLNHKATYRIHGAHNKVLAFTDRASKAGIDNYLDYFIRDRKFLLRPYLLICEGEPMDLLNVQNNQTKFLGLYFEQLLKNELAIADKEPKRLYEYVNLRSIGAKTAVIDLVSVQNNTIFKEEAAVIMDDKMVETLNEEELIAFNTMMSNTDEGYITVPHPYIKDKLVTLEIIKRRIKTNIEYKGNNEVVKLEKKINLKLSFNETQDQIDLTETSIRQKIEEEIKKKIVEESEQLFDKYKKKHIDIFHVEEVFNRKYPKANQEEVLNITELDMKVEIIFEGSPDTQGFTND